jgi:prepilin-type processing-associated H-X9-DG protein
MSFITAIGTAVPQHKISQQQIATFMSKAMRVDYESGRKLNAIFRSSGVIHRHSVLEDYTKAGDYSFYPNNKDLSPFPSTEKRNAEYRKYTLPLSLQAIQKCFNSHSNFNPSEITHLITVTCTGFYAPGLDIELIKELKLKSSVERLAINFMGCYAAFNAIKTANAYCALSPKNKVLIVCTELCSLHFQRETTDDNLLANALFADGSAAILVESEPSKGVSLFPEVFHNSLSFSEESHMAWNIGDFGFEMKLSSYVPDIIQKGIKSLTTEMLELVKKKITAIDFYAIHPGGKKILEVIETELGITKEQNMHAYDVLREYGNMSSPTVIFVLEKLFKTLNSSHHNASVLSFSFGPGLTLEGTLFSIKYTS